MNDFVYLITEYTDFTHPTVLWVCSTLEIAEAKKPKDTDRACYTITEVDYVTSSPLTTQSPGQAATQPPSA